MFPFDVILFDVGGVLLTNGWDHNERAQTALHFGLDLADFEARHSAAYPAWERDETSIKTYLDATVFYEPRGFSFDDFFAYMLTLSKPLQDNALGILEELAISGNYFLGSLNNESRETNDYRFRTYGLRDLFEVALSSCYLGLRKPDAAIYRRAIDILGRPAERILFIDDREENAAAARAAGMKAIRFTGADDLRRELTQLKVI
jgi:putative hydrolase of the HAD superfamily